MSTEVERIDFGMTDKGQVVVIVTDHYTDDGETKYLTFVVKHGVRTIGEYPTKRGAVDVAKAIAA